MKEKLFISLNVKVFLLGIVISLIPITVIGAMLYRKTLEIVSQKQETASANALDSILDSIYVTVDYVNNLSLFIIQNQDVKDALLPDTMTAEEHVRLQNRIGQSLIFYSGQDQFIKSIYIRGLNGMVFQSGVVRDLDSREQMMEKAIERQGSALWTGTRNSTTEGEAEYLTISRSIRDAENLDSTLGALWIHVPASKIKRQFSDYIKTYPGYIALLDEDGECLVSAGDAEHSYEDLDKLKAGGWDSVLNEEDNTLIYGTEVQDTGWKVVSSLELSTLLSENRAVRNLLFLSIIVSLVLCLLTTFIFSRIVLQPLKLLAAKIGEIKEDNYNVQIPFESNDEIGILSRQFNAMTKRMNELVNEVFRQKVLQTEAELQALQAQINPHFLFNNLDTAYWMSRLEHAEKTGRVVLAISQLCRTAMNAGQKLITVKEEMKYVENYILIQELRTAGQIQFHIAIDEDVLEMPTISFVIQPLVENSIQHGFLEKGRTGEIWIRGFTEEGNLYFEVEDNGDGADILELEELLVCKSNEKRGMAIRNIDQRIKIQFGNNYGLYFSKVSQGGLLTRVVQLSEICFKEKG